MCPDSTKPTKVPVTPSNFSQLHIFTNGKFGNVYVINQQSQSVWILMLMSLYMQLCCARWERMC